VVGLIQAFNRLKADLKVEHHLVLIGQPGWQYGPILREIAASPWRNCIHRLGYLSDKMTALFYQHADVFAYPSFYEGFGLPVLEAMTLGCPVVTSNTSSLPEVVGDAALMVNPDDGEDLAAALGRVIGDRPLRQTLIERGRTRAAQFSWERTALETLKAYRSLL
jgi:glycosyltransferase involved in cell wall biosynthesis